MASGDAVLRNDEVDDLGDSNNEAAPDENTAPRTGHNIIANNCKDMLVGDQNHYHSPVNNHFNGPTLTINILPGESIDRPKKNGRNVKKRLNGDGPTAAAIEPAGVQPQPITETSTCSPPKRPRQALGVGSQQARSSNTFNGKTIKEVFGPFTPADHLGTVCETGQKVNLFGVVVLKHLDQCPNEIDKEERQKNKTGCKFRQILEVELEMDLANGEKVTLPLEAMYDTATRLNQRFKKGKHIILGVKIVKAIEDFNKSSSQYKGSLRHAAVCCLSSDTASLDTKADDVWNNFSVDQVPIVMLSTGVWPSGKFVLGKLISKDMPKKPSKQLRLSAVFMDETGTLEAVAFGSLASHWNKKGRLLKDKVYKIDIGINGYLRRLPDLYCKTSCPFQLQMGQATKFIKQLGQ